MTTTETKDLRTKIADVIRAVGQTCTPGELADHLMVVVGEHISEATAESGRRAAERDHLRAEVAGLRRPTAVGE